MARRIIGSDLVRDAGRRGLRVIEVGAGDIVTAAGRETAESLGVRLVDGPVERPAVPATDGAVAARRVLHRRSPRWTSPRPREGLNPARIPRLAVVGAGGVGSNVAHLAANRGAAEEIVIVDIAPGLAEAVALDLMHASGITRTPTVVRGSARTEDVAGASVVVVAAGRPRTPGMSRADLADANRKVLRSVGETVRVSAPDAVVIVVTNPLEEMTAEMLATTGFARERVLGMAGTLDSSRFRNALAARAKVPVADVEAEMLGSHGPDMVPLASSATIRGRPVSEFLGEDEIAESVRDTVTAGGQVVALRKTGSATLAPAHAVVELLDLMRNARAGELPVSVLLKGELGIDGAVVGVPCKLGMSGVLEIVTPRMSGEEREMFERAAHRLADGPERA